MRWSFRLFSVFGIELKVHVTFFLVLLWGAGLGQGGHWQGAAFGIATVVLLFVCVTLHEFGHALVAKRFGVPVREIILLPIGGVAMLGRSPEKPVHELLIAIAGPAVNVVIAALLWGILFLIPHYSGLHVLAALQGALVALQGKASITVAMVVPVLLYMNIMLIVFNLIPAFPLDGGRVLRAILWMRMPMARATQVAASVGQFFAMLMGLWGLFTQQWLLAVVALFIFMGAGAESAAAQAVMVLHRRRVGDAYNKYALKLTLDDRVSRVIDYVLTSYQPDFAVLNRGKFHGVVTREDVLKWVAANDYDVYVTEIMHDDVLRVDAKLALDEVLKQLQENQKRLAAVFDGERFLGLVSAEDIAEAQLVLSFVYRPHDGDGRSGFRPIEGGKRVEPTPAEPETEPIAPNESVVLDPSRRPEATEQSGPTQINPQTPARDGR